MVDLTLINLKNRISEKKNELKNYKLTSNENDRFNKHYTSVHQIIAYETYLNELLKKYKPRDNMKYVEIEVEKPVYEETIIDRPVDRPVEKIVEKIVEKKVTVHEDNEKINTLKTENNNLKQQIDNCNEEKKQLKEESEELKKQIDAEKKRYLLEKAQLKEKYKQEFTVLNNETQQIIYSRYMY